MSAPSYFAVIMAGGRGTRFWPASRKDRPKQFLPIAGDAPMITQTARRIQGLVDLERTLVVTGADQVDLVREAAPEIPVENILAEPCGRNTAACCAFAAEIIHRRDPNSIQFVLPADHVIEPESRFRETLDAAAQEAHAEGTLVTGGIRPTFPATGYGYIEACDELAQRNGHPVQDVRRFVEKPDEARAREFLDAGNFLWNAGIFIWRTDAIRAAFAEYANEIYAPIRDAADIAAIHSAYDALPSLPIDVAIMEKANNVRVLPLDYSWNDVGSWNALEDVLDADAAGNVKTGSARLIAEDAENCIVYGDANERIALLGVDDLVVVRAGDTTLVCPKSRAQDVKRIVERLEREDPEAL